MCVCTHFNLLLHPFPIFLSWYREVRRCSRSYFAHYSRENWMTNVCWQGSEGCPCLCVCDCTEQWSVSVTRPRAESQTVKYTCSFCIWKVKPVVRHIYYLCEWVATAHSLMLSTLLFLEVCLCALPFDEECAACCLVPLKEQRAQQHAAPAVWICSLILRGGPPMFIPQNLFSCDSCWALPLSFTSPFLALTCSLNMYSHMSRRSGCWNAALLFSPAVHSCDTKSI